MERSKPLNITQKTPSYYVNVQIMPPNTIAWCIYYICISNPLNITFVIIDAHIEQQLCHKKSGDHAESVSMVFLKSKITGEVHQQMLPIWMIYERWCRWNDRSRSLALISVTAGKEKFFWIIKRLFCLKKPLWSVLYIRTI